MFILYVFSFLGVAILLAYISHKLISGKCPNGGFHDWEYKSDYDVIGKSHYLHEFYMGLNGHNVVERNIRYECKKCNKVEKRK